MDNIDNYQLWTPETGLEYWYKYSETHYIDQIVKKYRIFDVAKVINKYFTKSKIGLVVDIGGGKYGGFLYLYKEGKYHHLVDLLANKFKYSNDKKLAKLPDNITAVTCDFADMPYKENVDIMFSQESLDHCYSETHYNACIKKIISALISGGLFFHEWPVREKIKDHHILPRSCEQVIEDFSELRLISNKKVKSRCYLIFQKQ